MYILNTEQTLLEELKKHPYINQSIKIEFFTEPFHHIRLVDVFKNDIYNSLCDNFMRYISRTKPYKDQPGAAHNYAAYIYAMKKEDCINGYDFFIDPVWRNFISSTFNTIFNRHIALSAHWHKSPGEVGFIHSDFNIVSTIEDNTKDIQLTGNCLYSDDSIDKQPRSTKIMRSVALLFYFNNKSPLMPEDKGGTSIYTSYSFDTLVKEIPADNNTIFGFEIHPYTLHGFSGSSFDRSSIIQWFHSSPAQAISRHLNFVKEHNLKHKLPYERWSKKNNLWPIEHDPEYAKFFDKPFAEILEKE